MLASIMCLVILQALFTASNIAASSLPRATLTARAEDAWESPLLSRRYSYDHRILTAPVSYDNNRFIPQIAEQHDAGNPFATSVQARIDDRNPDGSTTTFDYFRYWHGWQLLTDLGLLAGGIPGVQAIVFVLLIGSIAWFTYELSCHMGTIASLVFAATAFLATGFAYNFAADLTLGISSASVIVASALVLRAGHISRSGPLETRRLLCLIALASGAIYCFLDFLTIPAAMLALFVFSGTVALDRPDTPVRTRITTIALLTAAFLVGFLVTWVAKWALAAITLGPEEVMHNVLNEMGVWTSEHGELPRPDWAAWQQSFYLLSPQLFALIVPLGYMVLNSPVLAIAVIATVTLLIIENVQGRTSKARHASTPALSWGRLFTLALPMAFIPLYTLVMSTHAVVHIPVFSCRIWSIFFAIALGLLIWRATPASRGSKPAGTPDPMRYNSADLGPNGEVS
ncbi:hypothetical protein [Collinsella sp. An2]|uniref:hypothetical protein n=1 Tax=Collinsella sp. An2 TaxID=1965585 RepID=UPI00117CB77B|nr:hypothetical protein [Collinsella sp. An2]